MSARLDVLVEGYVGDRVASTCTLIRSGVRVIVVDPGMVSSRAKLLDPLLALGIPPDAVTDIVISHHHPDHTVNIALFPAAQVHDFMATYRDDLWIDRARGPFEVADGVNVRPTPGHTAEDVTTLVDTESGLVALTHLWWGATGPADDPFAPDRAQLRASREQVLALEPALIVPGHGAPFSPSATTPL